MQRLARNNDNPDLLPALIIFAVGVFIWSYSATICKSSFIKDFLLNFAGPVIQDLVTEFFATIIAVTTLVIIVLVYIGIVATVNGTIFCCCCVIPALFIIAFTCSF